MASDCPAEQLVEIRSLAQGGHGVATSADGRTLFVPGTVPGDRLRCRITEVRRRYLRGQLVELVQSGPERIVPQCRHFGDCGGCDWQMLAYADQCRYKQQLLQQTCAHRLGAAAAECLEPLLASETAFGYRSRAQLKAHAAGGAFALGFYRRGSHFVVDVQDCPLLAAPLRALLAPLRQLFAGTPYAAWVPQIDAATDDAGAIRLLVHYRGEDLAAFCRWLQPRLATLAVAGPLAVLVQAGRKARIRLLCGEPQLRIRVDEPPLWLAYGPGGFAQVHLAQNRALVARLLDWAAVQPSDQVLDLYCGMGNFTLPLARRAARATGVEDYAPSIEAARANARETGLAARTVFEVAATADCLSRLTAAPDLVVLDPPRSGAYEAVAGLVRLRPSRLVYVSCDPQTLLRDLVPLLGQGYDLLRLGALDLFPQTHHTEVVALLQARG